LVPRFFFPVSKGGVVLTIDFFVIEFIL
jgi:hypothetical protein